MKVLILGDGLLGTELKKQTDWDLISRKLNNLPDLNNTSEFNNIMQQYDIVVNCIANTDSYSKDKKLHWDTNYKFIKVLSEVCNKNKIKLVQISTEFVYARNNTPPSEDDLPMPDNTWYAYTKLLADEYVKLNCDNYLICRELHKPFPFPYPKVWRVKTSGDTVDKIASIIITLIKNKASGVFNVGTGTKFLKDIASTSIEIDPPSYAPVDTSMNLTKLNNFYAEHNLYS